MDQTVRSPFETAVCLLSNLRLLLAEVTCLLLGCRLCMHAYSYFVSTPLFQTICRCWFRCAQSFWDSDLFAFQSFNRFAACVNASTYIPMYTWTRSRLLAVTSNLPPEKWWLLFRIWIVIICCKLIVFESTLSMDEATWHWWAFFLFGKGPAIFVSPPIIKDRSHFWILFIRLNRFFSFSPLTTSFFVVEWRLPFSASSLAYCVILSSKMDKITGTRLGSRIVEFPRQTRKGRSGVLVGHNGPLRCLPFTLWHQSHRNAAWRIIWGNRHGTWSKLRFILI